MLNLNVGILGHVDSGKTSLAKVLSKVASTAAFDKNPQSQERGITLDLGFSSFIITTPSHLIDEIQEDCIQFTLVDCPGHASLIRTVIGGAQIIDMMLLIIDGTKGIQTQTAECLVIGELTCKSMIIVLNKIDKIASEQPKQTEKVIKKIKNVLLTTIFKDSPLVCTAANPENSGPIGITDLIETMSKNVFLPRRNNEAPFLFSVDHCFGIKGQGAIMTGTVLQGTVNVNDLVEIPVLNLSKKIKSIQMFRQPVARACQGDRIGISIAQFNPKQFERGIVCASDYSVLANAAIISAERIKYFKFPINTKSKFHISIGHETVMASITCFCINRSAVLDNSKFNFDLTYEFCDELRESDDKKEKAVYNYILLEFEKSVVTVPNCLVIGSKLEMDFSGNMCRLAFWGKVLETTKDKNYKTSFLPSLKIYKNKQKLGVVERIVNNNEVIIKNMFKKETNVQRFIGLQVTLSTGETGKIDSQFGQSGKIKVYVPNGLSEICLHSVGKKSDKNSINVEHSEPVTALLIFRRYIFDVHKTIVQ